MYKKSENFICYKSLKIRGWTDKSIEGFLGDPDKVTRNPFYRSAAPMKLFLLDRVEEAEDNIDYQNLLIKKNTFEVLEKILEAKERMFTSLENMLKVYKSTHLNIDHLHKVVLLDVVAYKYGESLVNSNQNKYFKSIATMSLDDKKDVLIKFFYSKEYNVFSKELSNVILRKDLDLAMYKSDFWLDKFNNKFKELIMKRFKFLKESDFE